MANLLFSSSCPVRMPPGDASGEQSHAEPMGANREGLFFDHRPQRQKPTVRQSNAARMQNTARQLHCHAVWRPQAIFILNDPVAISS